MSADELGKRLLAALLSYQYGHKGVDRMLKRLRQGKIDSKWGEIALDLLAKMGDDIATTKTRQHDKKM